MNKKDAMNWPFKILLPALNNENEEKGGWEWPTF